MSLFLANFWRFLFSLTDILFCYLLLVLTWFVRFHSGIVSTPKGIPDFFLYNNTFWIVSIFLYLVLSFNGQYHRDFRFTAEKSWNLSKSIFLCFLLLTTIAFFYKGADYSRTTFVLALMIVFLGMNLFHFLKDRLLSLLRPKFFRTIHVAVLGEDARALDLCTTILNNATNLNLCLIGEKPQKEIPGVFYLGKLDDFTKIIEEKVFDEVIIALPKSKIKETMELIDRCAQKNIRYSVLPELFEIVTRQTPIASVLGVPVVTLSSTPSYNLQLFLKRSMDFTFSLLSILVFSPVLLLIYIGIKLEDGGPIFYSQERVGLNGKTFMMYKFRSMRVDAESKTGPMWAIKGDPRWTLMGTILRKTSIDELPQLWNVLKGDMSLVGPRPERPFFVDQFKEQIPGYMLRHRVRGGLSGWAQANGLRGQSSIEDRTAYDLYYVENWSLSLDIKIIFQTLFKFVFIQSGY